ncbi:DUF732 domain-containing protein [Streptomyces bauhiniae]|uniref:DUF732 domain-containing protein n=1 Tax=Streptomyces bauhiniae TaxID=2340725 RepID=UPI0035E17D84
MNTRTTAAALLAAAALALTGCSGTDSAADRTNPKPSAPKATATHSVQETAYLTAVRAKVPALERLSDKQLIDFGHTSCDAIDAGNSPAAVAERTESGMKIGAQNSGYLVGSAVSQFCPEHKDQL